MRYDAVLGVLKLADFSAAKMQFPSQRAWSDYMMVHVLLQRT